MTDPNPFAPPRAAAVEPQGLKAWFLRRPIPVFIVGAFCVLQYAAILTELSRHWAGYLGLMNSGAIAPLGFLVKLLYPTLLCAAGVCLLLLWTRTAVALFGGYLAWGLARFVAGTPTDYFSLAIVFACLVYSLRLAARVPKA